MAVTSHFRVSFWGWVLMPTNLLPPILGLLCIWTLSNWKHKMNVWILRKIIIFSVFMISYTCDCLLLRKTQAPCLRHVMVALENKIFASEQCFQKPKSWNSEQEVNYYILLPNDSFVKCLSFNKKHWNLLIQLHIHSFIIVSYGMVQRLAITSVHNCGFHALQA